MAPTIDGGVAWRIWKNIGTIVVKFNKLLKNDNRCFLELIEED